MQALKQFNPTEMLYIRRVNNIEDLLISFRCILQASNQQVDAIAVAYVAQHCWLSPTKAQGSIKAGNDDLFVWQTNPVLFHGVTLMSSCVHNCVLVS